MVKSLRSLEMSDDPVLGKRLFDSAGELRGRSVARTLTFGGIQIRTGFEKQYHNVFILLIQYLCLKFNPALCCPLTKTFILFSRTNFIEYYQTLIKKNNIY